MLRTCLFAGLICLVCWPRSVVFGQESRDWRVERDDGPQTITAEAVDLEGGKIVLRDEAGTKHSVPLVKLHEDERKQALFDVIGRGVVRIATKDALGKAWGSGSGFLFQKDGYLLTNYHVVRGAATIQVEFRGAEAVVDANCLAYDRALDVAVLKLAKMPEGAHVLTLARDEPGVGSVAWTLGYPHGILTPDWGAANGVHKTMDLPENLRVQLRAPDDTLWIQTNAVLTNGSSGGPLLNAAGEVIGMNTFFVGPQQGFALYIAHARTPFLEATKAKPLSLPIPPGDEEPTLGWLSQQVAPRRMKYEQEMLQLQSNPDMLPLPLLMQQQLDINERYRKQYLTLAREHPASWPSTQALLLACDLARDNTEAGQKALAEVAELVTKHHLESRKVFEFIIPLVGRSDDASRSLCRRILADSPHSKVKAYAAYALANGQINWLATHGVMDLKQLTEARAECKQLIAELQGPYGEVTLAGYPLKQCAIGLRDSLAATPVGMPAKAIKGKNVEGEPLQLADHAGKVVMLDFFADYCPPCRSMYDFEKKLVERMKDRPFLLLGVNGDEPKKLAEITKAGTIQWPTLADGPSGPIANDWRVDRVPWIFLIDKDGIVRRQFIGAPTEDVLGEALDALIQEAETANRLESQEVE